MRPRVIVFELLTTVWYTYVLACSRIEGDLFSIVATLDKILLILGTLLVAWAVWKRRAWSPKAAVIVAAFIGLPTLVSTIGRLEPIVLASDSPAHAIPWIGYPFMLLCQLGAFFEGLGQLRSRDAAA